MQMDLRVAQLLSSRLCHDLVGPIGAVNTGLELLQEGFDDDEKALGLVADSAGEASRRLTFFRGAFGFGAGDKGEATLNEARKLALGLLASGKVALDWPEDADASLQASAVKVTSRGTGPSPGSARRVTPGTDRGGRMTLTAASSEKVRPPSSTTVTPAWYLPAFS